MWKKCSRAGQPTDDNTAHAHCMLDSYGYRHTLRMCDTYCFSTATMVTRTRLNVILQVHCLSYLMLNLVVQKVTIGSCSLTRVI